MLRLPKNQNILQKTSVLAIFGPRAPSGSISALFPGVGRALQGGAAALITLVHWIEGAMRRYVMVPPIRSQWSPFG